jgi:hypothetical protein
MTLKGIRSKGWLGCLMLAACAAFTGCTGDYSGQLLPSPYYMSHQIQYFPPGPEFKLTREAAAQKAYRETQAQREGERQQ